MSQKVISFHYKLTNSKGEQLDSSEGQDALAFLTGSNQIISGLEKEIISLNVGDKKTIQVSSEEAYGPKLDDRVAEVPREQFPADAEIEVGMMFSTDESGQSIVTVTAITESSVTVDGNHPLAGQPVTFVIDLVEIL